MKTQLGIYSLLTVLLVGWGMVVPVSAQEVHQELQETVRAEVLEIVEEEERAIMGTDSTTTVQTLRIELLEGTKTGEVATLDNDILVLKVGEIIIVNRLVAIDGTEYFIFKDAERRPQLAYLFVFMVLLVVAFAGWQGLQALLSLFLSVVVIMYVLVPALLAGYSPALVSLGIAGVILAVSLFLTHGFGARVVVAFFGTWLAVLVTCVIAGLAVPWLRLTGFSSDASVYLNFSTGGTLDFAGLLLGSIIIGLLGVLDDVSITQASVVQELRSANSTLGVRELYSRAIKVGRDHVGSLVNTLALAYVGAALPLVLLFARSDATFLNSLNQEVIASEVVRIMIGSMGLIAAVPLTTLLAAWYFARQENVTPLKEHGHTHHH